MPAKIIKILNPVEGGVAFTSTNRARRYVKASKAVWEGESIRFVERQQRIVLEAFENHRNEIGGPGYDSVRRGMKLAELRAIPVMQAERLFRK